MPRPPPTRPVGASVFVVSVALYLQGGGRVGVLTGVLTGHPVSYGFFLVEGLVREGTTLAGKLLVVVRGGCGQQEGQV